MHGVSSLAGKNHTSYIVDSASVIEYLVHSGYTIHAGLSQEWLSNENFSNLGNPCTFANISLHLLYLSMPIKWCPKWSTDEAGATRHLEFVRREFPPKFVTSLSFRTSLAPKYSLIYDWKSHSPKPPSVNSTCAVRAEENELKTTVKNAKTDVPIKSRCMLWKRKITKDRVSCWQTLKL